MSVSVTKTTGGSAEITWENGDDPHGWLARAVEGDQLAYALEALGDGEAERNTDRSESDVRQAAFFTNQLAGLLERRAAVQVVRLRDDYGMSWRQIAESIHEDPEKQSTIRRQYETGRRIIGY
jgi:hypothetical protein